MSERKHEMSMEMPAPVEEVWRMLSEGENIPAWFAPLARMEDGKLWLSWGEGMEGEAPIIINEPNSRIAWQQGAQIIDFTLEANGASTIVRLVHSGFGADAKFDGEYDSTYGGWLSFLHVLQYHCAHFLGAPCKHVFVLKMMDMPPAELMPKLLAALSFKDGYTARFADIDLSGSVLFSRGDGYRVLSVDLGGVLGLFAEGYGGKTALTTSWYLKGPGAERAAEIESKWNEFLAGVTS